MNKQIRFPLPAEAWSSNDRRHWSKFLPLKKAWRKAAWVYGAAARPAGMAPSPVNIQVTIPFRTNRVRDPHNYVGTVVKAVVDGLKDAGYYPDDNPKWVRVIEPRLTIGTEVIIDLTPMDKEAR